MIRVTSVPNQTAATTAAKTGTFGSKLASGTAKAAGCVGLAAIAYDAHKLGKVRAGETKREAIATSGLDAYVDSKSLDKPSALMSKIQDVRFSAEMNGKLFNGVRNFFNSAKGYVKGVAESLVSNVVPLALSAVSIMTKGNVSKAAAIGLTAYGGVEVAKNAFGAGKTHYLK